MNEQGKVAKISGHENSSFEFVLFDNCVYFMPNLRLLEVSKGSYSFAEGNKVGAGEAACVGAISFSFMLVDLILNAPVDKSLDIFSGLQVLFDLFLPFCLLILDILFCLPLDADFLHHSAYRLILFDIGSQLVLWDKREIVFEEVELSYLFVFIVFGVLNGDDISGLKGIIYIGEGVLVTRSK